MFYESDTQIFGDQKGRGCPRWELTIRWKARHHSNSHTKAEIQMVMKAGTVKKHKTLSKPSNSCPLSQIKIQSPHCGIRALHDPPPPYPSEITSPHCAPATMASWLFLNCAGHIPTSGPLHLLSLLPGKSKSLNFLEPWFSLLSFAQDCTYL